MFWYALTRFDELSQPELEKFGSECNDKELNDLRKELLTLKEHSTEEVNKLIQNQHHELNELR